MKALILIENDRIADLVRFYIGPLGFEAIRYRNPLKALDNLPELEPEAIIVSARDYPRHWKVLAQAVRAERGKDECVLVLLKGEHFPFDEAAKASHLGVNGVLSEELGDRREQSRLQRILKRYVEVSDGRHDERLAPSPWDRLDFVFSHPKTLVPVVGQVETVSRSGLSFLPESATVCRDILAGTRLEDCSMRVGDRILSLSCLVARSERVLGLSIESMSDEERAYYEEYLDSCPEREMKALLKKG